MTCITLKAGESFGDLVVCVPINFSDADAGDLKDPDSVTYFWFVFESSTISPKTITYPPHQGPMITYTYDLKYKKDDVDIDLVNVNDRPIYSKLEKLMKASYLSGGGKIAFGFQCRYPHEKFFTASCFRKLDLSDLGPELLVYLAASRIGLEANIKPSYPVDISVKDGSLVEVLKDSWKENIVIGDFGDCNNSLNFRFGESLN